MAHNQKVGGSTPSPVTTNKIDMEIKFKKLSEKAVMHIRGHEGDAGVDLTVTRITTEINECGQRILVYHSDIAVEIPTGYVGLLFPRSSIFKKSLAMTNSVGVIDSGYRGELMVKFRATTDVVPALYKEGERFTQLVSVPYLDYKMTETDELTESERGSGGYGSSDEKIVSAATGSDEQTEPVQAAGQTEQP